MLDNKVPAMKRLFFLFIIVFLQLTSNAQQKENSTLQCKWEYDSVLHCKIYTLVDQMPKYKMGMNSTLNFFMKNFKYPTAQDRFQGSVNLVFIVSRNGEVLNTHILNKRKCKWTLVEKEALRVLKTMPNWVPGKCHGVNVPVKVILPIKF